MEEQLAFDVAEFPGGIYGAIEAVLMVVDEPVTTMSLASVLEQPVHDVEEALADLQAGYNDTARVHAAPGRRWLADVQPPRVRPGGRLRARRQQARLTQASLRRSP